MNTTGALPRLRIPGDPVLARPVVPTGTIKLDDLALNVMTDFLQATPITVDGDTPVDEALQHMIHAGVRLLFATGRDSRLIGLITSNDILGEKPIRHMQAIEPQKCAKGGIFGSASEEKRESFICKFGIFEATAGARPCAMPP